MRCLAQLKTLLLLPLAGAALLAPSSVRAQTPYTTWAQSYGVGSYDGQGNPVTGDTYGSGNDTPSAVAAMPDGGFVVAGALDLPELYLRNSGGTDHSGSANTALVRYAADGHIVWQQILRQDNDQYDGVNKIYTFAHNYVNQMLADAQGNLYLRMHKDYLALTAPSEAVAKFAPDGTLIWQVGYNGDIVGDGADAHGAGPAPFTSMSLTADGGVVISGGENYGSGASQPFYAKINADGTLGAHRPFVNNGQYDSAGAAAQSADGTHFIVGMNAIFPDGTHLYASVVLLDASDNIVAERSFANDAGLGETPAHILANDDGTFTMLSIGAAYGGVYYVPSAYIVRKLAADLTPIWEKVITNISNPCNSLGRTSDGGYLLTSVNAGNDVLGGTFGSSNADLVVLRLNRDGALTSSFLLGGTDAEDGQAFFSAPTGIPSVTQTTDGSFGLAVSSLSYHLADSINRPDWWVVKADLNGRVHGFGGIMNIGVPEYFNAHDNTVPSVSSNHYSGFPQGYGPNADERYNPAPNFVIEDLGAKTGVNRPTVLFQANPSTAPLLTPPGVLSVAVQLPAEVDSDYTLNTDDSDSAPGLFLRVQYNPTPLLESGWTDLPGGGQMTSDGAGHWSLRTNAVPQTTGDASTTGGLPIAFRAIAATPGYADGAGDFYTLLDVGPSTVPVFSGTAAYTVYVQGPDAYNLDPVDVSLTSLFTPRATKVTAISGLPPGVTLDTSISSTSIYGNPTQAGTYKVQFTVVENTGGRTASGALTITVLPSPAITSSLAATAVEGQPFSYQIMVSNFTPTTYGFYSSDFSGLPPGLSFDKATGLLTGTVDPSVFTGDYGVSISAQNADNTVLVQDTLTLTIKSAASAGSARLVLTGASNADSVVVGSNVRYTFTVTNNGPDAATNLQGQVATATDALTLVTDGSTPGITTTGNAYTFALPDLASGANESYSLIFTANTPGNYIVVSGVTADQANPDPVNSNTPVTTTVTAASAAAHAPVITAPPGGQIIAGEDFSYQITTDGTVPVDTFAVTGLPTGLSVDPATGLVSGSLDEETPPGTFDVTLRAANGAGASTAPRTFTVVTPPTTAKTIDVTASLGTASLKLLADKGKYKLTVTGTLSNLGTKAINPTKPVNPLTLTVGAFLSNSPTFSYPLVADPAGAGLLPLSLALTPVYDASVPPKLVSYSARVTAPSDAKPASLGSIAAKLNGAGKSGAVQTVNVTAKFSATDLPVFLASGQYRYLLLVLDPEGSLPETSKSNNVVSIDLGALLQGL